MKFRTLLVRVGYSLDLSGFDQPEGKLDQGGLPGILLQVRQVLCDEEVDDSSSPSRCKLISITWIMTRAVLGNTVATIFEQRW